MNTSSIALQSRPEVIREGLTRINGLTRRLLSLRTALLIDHRLRWGLGLALAALISLIAMIVGLGAAVLPL